MDKNNQNNSIVNFLFEVGILSKTPRSYAYFLGSGSQSVAEHINRVCFIGYVLCFLNPKANMDKVLKMCLFHDLAEARTSDLNYVHQKYAKADETKALSDIAETVPFGDDIKSLVEERNAGKTLEAQLAKDADRLEWLLTLKEHSDTGNTRAESWMPSAFKRLKTDSAIKLGETIQRTMSDDWWFADKESDWWVTRNKE